MLILERFTAGGAVIADNEKNTFAEAELSMLGQGVKVGDVLILENGTYFTDAAATEQRKKDIIKLQDSLFE